MIATMTGVDTAVSNGQVGLKVPKQVIQAKSPPFRRHGKPVARQERADDTPYSILAQYQQDYRGLAEYYQLAVNRYQLNRLKWVMERSLTCSWISMRQASSGYLLIFSILFVLLRGARR